MSQQPDRFPKTTPTYDKKDQGLKVLREKQIGSIAPASTAHKSTPLYKPTRPTNLNKNKTLATNENIPVSASKIPGRCTPRVNVLSKAKQTHLHQNDSKLSTPLNRNVRSAFGSSVKQDSASNDNSARKLHAKPPIVSNSSRVATPINRNYLASSTNTNSKASYKLTPNKQDSIINGHDYSAIMARKAELGYSGVGYVVEYDCDEKELKNIVVQKGLWKISTFGITPNKTSKYSFMGQPTFATRLDVQSTNTPAKSLFNNNDVGWINLLKTPGILRNGYDDVKKSLHLSDEYMNNSTAQCLDLETSHNKHKKKCLRWADNLDLDRIDERQSPANRLSPYYLTPKHVRSSGGSSGGGSGGSLGKMRRSLSMNDINNIILTEDEDKNESLTNQSMDHRIQLNYNSQGSVTQQIPYSSHVSDTQQPVAVISLNETFELQTASLHLFEKLSLIDIDAVPKSMNYEADSSLSELMIPFTLSSHDKTLEDEVPEPRLDIANGNSKLIDNLNGCNASLGAWVACLHLNEDGSQLPVSTSEFIKISNLVVEMEKSLRTIKEKLSFK